MGTGIQNIATSFGLLVLRLGIGGYLATHGWGKLQMVLEGNFADFGDPIGLGAGASLVLAMSAEFICSILVMVGFLTRLAAIPPAFTMAVAAFVVHANDPWTMSQTGGSKEPALLFLIPFIALVFTGSGRFSLDGIIWRRKPQVSA